MSSRKYQDEWEKNARLDPLYAILSSPEARGGQWAQDRFFATGHMEIDLVFAELASLGALPARDGRFLDFGCGVGRLSQALSLRFASGVGIDISARMIELAKAYGAQARSLDFVQNSSADLHLVPSGSISFVYSHIVLQHVSNDLQCSYISEFCRVLAPGGIAAFQIPIESLDSAPPPPRPSLIKRMVPAPIKEAIKRGLGRPTQADIVTMEMNILPDESVASLVRAGGCDLVAMRFSNSAEPDHNGRVAFFDRSEAVARVADGRSVSKLLSGFYFVRKRGGVRA